MSIQTIFLTAIVAFGIYSIGRSVHAFYLNLRSARAIGLPIKIIPFPPGLFSFFAFQIVRRLLPGTKLYQLLNMGRPDGYDLHKEMGDVFVSVSPAGLTLIIADPTLITQIHSKRAEFPKSPNTGEIINIYGRNVINSSGDTWRFHRRVTGPAFSERIHHAVWQESMNQARLMMQSWQEHDDEKDESVLIASIEDDLLHMGLNVITGAVFGYPLGWEESPPCAVSTRLSYSASLEQFTAYLMPVFLTPQWILRLAWSDSNWGRAWEAYIAVGGYIRGMIDRERAGESTEENLLTALIHAEDKEDETDGRKMLPHEVMGNAFAFVFSGRVTTANTLHYALLLLAQRPEIQQYLLVEIDGIYTQAAAEGRSQLEYDIDFDRAHMTFAIMYETLRIYTPAGMTNKWTEIDQPIDFKGRMYVIPKGTRISLNGTGVHSNPKVWGEDATEWQPSRWIIEDGDSDALLRTSRSSWPPSPKSRLLMAPKGTFLSFSGGSRACPGKKFASVEFVGALLMLLREHRVEFGGDWSTDRVAKVLAGRKAGALTRQPPEPVPLRFVRRRR